VGLWFRFDFYVDRTSAHTHTSQSPLDRKTHCCELAVILLLIDW
jgi:hypothetical protein